MFAIVYISCKKFNLAILMKANNLETELFMDEILYKDCSSIRKYAIWKYSIVEHSTSYVCLQLFCPDGQASSMAAIWMQTPEASVRSLFHDQSGKQS